MTGPGSQLAVLLYGLDLLVASLIMNAIIRRLSRRPRLLVDYVAVDDSHWMVRRRRTGLILNGLGIILAYPSVRRHRRLYPRGVRADPPPPHLHQDVSGHRVKNPEFDDIRDK